MELNNALNWFEIPVSDFDRAKKFYESLFDYQMPENQMGSSRMGFFLYDFKAGKIGGAIVYRPGFHIPNSGGALVYLNCNPDLQIILDRVEKSGGRQLEPKTPVGEGLGYWALISDSEGNRVALHSMQ